MASSATSFRCAERRRRSRPNGSSRRAVLTTASTACGCVRWLVGAGAVLKQAIAELKELQAEAPERTLALPILLRLRLTVPSDPAKQTTDDQEFLMDTQDIVETWRREAVQEGVEQGRKQGLEQGREQGREQGLKQGVAHS